MTTPRVDSIMPAGVPALRWGFVGTGGIANLIARHIATTPLARLTASSSRTMSSAREFADRHGAALAFDNWKALCDSDQVDAVYVATPTSVREEISTYAARAGKHVLAEKPFASAKSVRRIVAACRDNDVAFMDGTHFVHHPRTRMLKREALMNTGKPSSLDSAFQFALPDRGNIRYRPELEPMGAIGDAGWYNMRAAVEYLRPEATARSVNAVVRRDGTSGAIVAGAGVIQFDDGSTTTWNCGFDTGASVMTLRVTGPDGVISLDNFLHEDADHSASYHYRKEGSEPDAGQELRRIESHQSSVAAMFETFAAIAADASLRNDYATATLRTQTLLDACWESSELE
jgi:predicted dehydrogenase